MHTVRIAPPTKPRPWRRRVLWLGLLGLAACADKGSAVASGSTTEASSSDASTSTAESVAETTGSDTSTGGLEVVPCGKADGRVCGEPEDGMLDIRGLPSLVGCEVYRGSLVLAFAETADDLQPLSSLRVIESFLAFGGQTQLETAQGFECLEKVGDLVLAQHPKLRNFSGLENLVAIEEIEFGRADGQLSIGDASELTSLRGLENLRTVSEVIIGGTPLLTDLEGLSGLEEIKTGIRIILCPLLVDLAGLRNVRGFNGVLTLQELDGLVSLRGLEQTKTLSELTIVGNPVLADLDGLAGLERVTGNVEIVDNPSLPSEVIDAFLAQIIVEGEIILE